MGLIINIVCASPELLVGAQYALDEYAQKYCKINNNTVFQQINN